jgi:hypothetical protein
LVKRKPTNTDKNEKKVASRKDVVKEFAQEDAHFMEDDESDELHAAQRTIDELLAEKRVQSRKLVELQKQVESEQEEKSQLRMHTASLLSVLLAAQGLGVRGGEIQRNDDNMDSSCNDAAAVVHEVNDIPSVAGPGSLMLPLQDSPRFGIHDMYVPLNVHIDHS